jgi:CobQ-like glutamine amidotransferase family enzyme
MHRRRHGDRRQIVRAIPELRIVHLFPDVLRVYGDGANVMTIVQRAEARSISTTVAHVMVGAKRIPPADLLLIGGGQDREQVTVARELERLGGQLIDLVAGGAALLAVCGGYQNLGVSYRTSQGEDLWCPGLLPLSTVGFEGKERLVGPVVARVRPGLLGPSRPIPDAQLDDPSELPTRPTPEGTVVGFENHGARSVLEAGASPFAIIEIGSGNNGRDRTEGVALLPGEGGLDGLRIGTYLHGPLLPRNPHIADALIAAALGRPNRPFELTPLDDRLEWAAHRQARARLRGTARRDSRVPGWVHRALDPLASLR